MPPSCPQEALDVFCGPLTETVDNFEEQLTLNRHKLIGSMNRIQLEFKDYTARRLINHQFVQ